MRPEELANSIKALVSDLETKMEIDYQLVLYLLFKYKWNKEKLEEDYYSEHAVNFKKKHSELQQYLNKKVETSSCSVCLEES